MRLNEFPIMRKRYIQLLRVIQCIHCVLAYFAIKATFSLSDLSTFFSVPILLELMMIVGMQLLIGQVKKGRVSLAVGIHQSVTLFFLIVMALLSGGLSSPTIMVFPISLLMLSLYTSQKHYLVYFLIVLIVVVFIGLNDLFRWVGPDSAEQVYVDSRGMRLLITYAYTGLLAWVFVRDLRKAYTDKVRDRERIEEAKAKIQQLADTDPLTGLLNRYGAESKFKSLLRETDFTHSDVMVMFIDIDDFKSINDLYGHSIGDEVLTLIGQKLKKIVDENALVSRLGGDEFLVALVKDDASEGQGYLDKMMSDMSAPVSVDGVSIKLTSSIGVAKAVHAECTLDDVARNADIAMYQAKVDGKNHYCHYRDDLEQAYMANLNLLQGMQEAVDNDGLTLHYQPKIDTKTNEVMGAEALLRWEKFNPMSYTARQIIPVLETTNLIHDVGYWVIRTACQDCKAWQDEGSHLPVSVNVSSRQFMDGAFAENIKRILDEVGLPAESLMLEIAEEVLNQESFDALPLLHQIKSYGVKLSIDCFGVGHSNLASLANLEVDELKMDSDFTLKVASSHKARSIVKAFVKMANQLGIQLVASGVEKNEDSQLLQSMGCEIEQGFLWKRPVSAQEFGNLVRFG